MLRLSFLDTQTKRNLKAMRLRSLLRIRTGAKDHIVAIRGALRRRGNGDTVGSKEDKICAQDSGQQFLGPSPNAQIDRRIFDFAGVLEQSFSLHRLTILFGSSVRGKEIYKMRLQKLMFLHLVIEGRAVDVKHLGRLLSVPPHLLKGLNDDHLLRLF